LVDDAIGRVARGIEAASASRTAVGCHVADAPLASIRIAGVSTVGAGAASRASCVARGTIDARLASASTATRALSTRAGAAPSATTGPTCAARAPGTFSVVNVQWPHPDIIELVLVVLCVRLVT
jgi:hypothetical protein